MIETRYKARYAAQMLAATAVLASLAADDFHRRLLARPAFVYTHEFIRWARRAKNEAKQLKGSRETVRELERRLSRLEAEDYAPYREIRHRIAAHRQGFSPDVAENIVETNTAWNDISDAAVKILAEDARETWNLVAGLYEMPRLEHLPPAADELRHALSQETVDAADGVRIGAGSFDWTRPDTVPLHQGGELGERIRQIVDTVRNVQLLARVWPLVNGHEPYWRVIVSATFAEVAALVDLVYEQPFTAKAENRHPPLLALLETDPHADGLPHVRAYDPASDLEQRLSRIYALLSLPTTEPPGDRDSL